MGALRNPFTTPLFTTPFFTTPFFTSFFHSSLQNSLSQTPNAVKNDEKTRILGNAARFGKEIFFF